MIFSKNLQLLKSHVITAPYTLEGSQNIQGFALIWAVLYYILIKLSFINAEKRWLQNFEMIRLKLW